MLKVGQRFQKRYEITAQLGVGGMGTVYRARQTDVGRDVALKLLQEDGICDEETVKRFYREFKLLSKLQHPHIMTIYGLALDDHQIPYAICEYIQGKTLRKELSETGAMNWSRAVSIIMMLCDALKYSHEQGVLHRDLKPDNVMLMETPEPDFVKLIDFGLSRASIARLDESQKLTATGQLLGSPHYMCPESFAGKTHDERSDLYSLGCILFELLSGEKLFDSRQSIGILYMHAHNNARERFQSIKTSVPLSLVDILNKLLEKSPENRYQSAATVLSDLQNLMNLPGRLTEGKALTVSAASAEQAVKLRRLALLLTTAILVIFIGVSVLQKQLSQQNSASKEPSVQPGQGIRSQNQRARFKELFDLGRKLLKQGSMEDLAAAERIYLSASRLCTKTGTHAANLPACYAFRAKAEWLQEKIPEAESDFLQAFKLAQSRHDREMERDIYLQRVPLLIHSRRFTQALKEFNLASSGLQKNSSMSFLQAVDTITEVYNSHLDAFGETRIETISHIARGLSDIEAHSPGEKVQLAELALQVARAYHVIAPNFEEDRAVTQPLLQFALSQLNQVKGHEALKQATRDLNSRILRMHRTLPNSAGAPRVSVNKSIKDTVSGTTGFQK